MHSTENKSSQNMLKQTEFIGKGIRTHPMFWSPKDFAKCASKYQQDPVPFNFWSIYHDLCSRWHSYRHVCTLRYWQQMKQQEQNNNSNEKRIRSFRSLETLLTSYSSLPSFRALICYCRRYAHKWCTSSYSDTDTWNQFTYIKITFSLICFQTITSGSSHIKTRVIWYTKWRDLGIIFQEVCLWRRVTPGKAF